MSPKEKVIQLVTRVYMESMNLNNSVTVRWGVAKNCALITADEILNELVPSDFKDIGTFTGQKEYWQEVKSEIERL